MLNPEQYFQELKGFHKKLWLKDLEIVSLYKKFLMEVQEMFGKMLVAATLP